MFWYLLQKIVKNSLSRILAFWVKSVTSNGGHVLILIAENCQKIIVTDFGVLGKISDKQRSHVLGTY